MKPLTARELSDTPLHALADAAVPGAPLVISFSFAQWDQTPAFDFFGRLKKLELLMGSTFNRIFVRDPANAWYLRGVPGLGEDVETLADALRHAISRLRPSRVITLGQSMGGFASILFGHLLRADRVLAFGALSTMDPAAAAARHDTRWLSVMQSLCDDGVATPYIDLCAWCSGRETATPPAPEMRLHYGKRPDPDSPEARPENLDLWHASRWAALPNTTVCEHEQADHRVVQHLRDTRKLDGVLLRDLFDGDPAQLYVPGGQALDRGWVQWIAENRLRGCTPDSMVDGMQAAGVAALTARSALREVERDPCYLAATQMLALNKKLESVLANQQLLWERRPFAQQIERRSPVASEEFLERYVRGSRPLVLTGLMDDWPALQRWSPADLRQRFGEAWIEVQGGRSADASYEVNKLALRRQMRLADLVDQVLQGSGNDTYLTANNEALRQSALQPLLDDVGSLPDYCRRDLLAVESSLWFGAAGTVTPLHHDTLMLLHMHISGRKHWRFIAPAYTPRLYNFVGVFSPVDPVQPDLWRHPMFAGVPVLEVIAGPGDTVFIPLGWWHHVTALDTCISMSFSGFDFPNRFEYANPDIRHW